MFRTYKSDAGTPGRGGYFGFVLRLCVAGPLFLSPLLAESVDWIWSARYVITEDAQRRVISNGAIAVRGERIAGVGTKAETDARFQPKQRLDRPDAILA